jgi:ATP-dependent DNA ligase
MMRKKPMLAYPVSDKPIDYNKPTFIQPKLDGVRCVIQAEWLNPMTIEVKAYSRTGKEWKNINHILKQLTPFFKKYPNVILDGELYNHDLKDDFEKIISLVRKTKPTDENRVESAEMVQFHCYDTIMEHMSYDQRNEFINQALMLIPSVHIVDTNRVFKHEEALNIHHDANLANGYEGSILRTNDVYKCGRSWSLRKFKDFNDAEATIIGYLDGKGKRTGTLGKFIMQDDEGIEFGCPPGKGYTYKDLADMLDNISDYIGQRATFTFFERTKAGSYRHPLFKCIRDYE